MNKIKKVFLIMLVAMCVINATCFASNLSFGEQEIPGLEGPVSIVLGMIQWIGFVVGIGMVIWIGVKYITAGAGGKAEVKSTMVPWLVGAAFIALAAPIAQGIYSVIGGGGGGTGVSGVNSNTTQSVR